MNALSDFPGGSPWHLKYDELLPVDVQPIAGASIFGGMSAAGRRPTNTLSQIPLPRLRARAALLRFLNDCLQVCSAHVTRGSSFLCDHVLPIAVSGASARLPEPVPATQALVGGKLHRPSTGFAILVLQGNCSCCFVCCSVS
jgi:hypothetical protein